MTCNAVCLTCGGPGNDFCTSCNTSYVYLYNVSGGYCMDSCNATGYTLSATNCLACDDTCLTCVGIS